MRFFNKIVWIPLIFILFYIIKSFFFFLVKNFVNLFLKKNNPIIVYLICFDLNDLVIEILSIQMMNPKLIKKRILHL